MVITRLVNKRTKYFLVFITLGRQDSEEISRWIHEKLKGDIKEGSFKERCDKLFYMCEQKFGERPFVVDEKGIPNVRA